MSGNIFGCHSSGEGDYWNLVGRGPRCCLTSFNAQDRDTMNDLVHNADRAEVQKPCPRPDLCSL